MNWRGQSPKYSKNQQQVDAQGKKVGRNRPDLHMLNRQFTLFYANMGTVEAAIINCYKTDVKILKIQNAPLEVHLEKPIPYIG